MDATTSLVAPASRPVIKSIPVSALRVDLYTNDSGQHGYQRDPDAKFRKLAEKVKRQFDADLYNPLSVAEWQGEYFVYDGNLRRTVAEEAARDYRLVSPAMAEFFDHAIDPLLECRVTYNCPPNRQAYLFVQCNEDRRGVPWLNRHRAKLYQNDPVALEIEKVMAGLGLEIGRGSGAVGAVQALYSTIQFDGDDAPLRPELLHDVLHVANESWSVGRTKQDAQYCFSDRTLDALAMLFDEFDETQLPRADAILAFRRVLARDLINRAAAKTSAHGSNNASALAIEFAKEFNRKAEPFEDGHALRHGRLDPMKRRQALAKAKAKTKAKVKTPSRLPMGLVADQAIALELERRKTLSARMTGF